MSVKTRRFAPASMCRTCWSIRSIGFAPSDTETSAGLCRNSLANWRIWRGMVADSRTVCRLPLIEPRMCRIGGRKPISSI
jgi:hypothetical protein